MNEHGDERAGARWAASAATWVPAVVILGSWAAWSARLPDHLATHWTSLSRPDGFTSTTPFLAATLGIGVLCAVVSTVTAARHRPLITLRAVLPFAGALAGLVAGVWLATATATLAAASPESAPLNWRILIPIAGLAWGAAPLRLLGPLPAVPENRVVAGARRFPDVVLRPGEDSWSTRVRATWLLVIGALAIVPLVVAATVLDPLLWLVALVTAAVFSLFADIEVRVDRRGLRVGSGLWRLPFQRIPLRDIASVEVEQIEPLRWGGWGYRIMPGRSAVVLRAGPGLVVRRTNGRLFAVTLPDPEHPAALLEALRAPTG